MKRRLIALVSLTVLLTGCSGTAGSVKFGALPGTVDRQCVHLREGERVLVGDDLTTRDTAVTVRSISLSHEHGMRILHTYLLTSPGGTSLGVTDVPPAAKIAAEIGWTTRIDARDVVIPPHSTRNVVLEVQKTSSAMGSASAIHLQLSESGIEYERDSSVHYSFPAQCTR